VNQVDADSKFLAEGVQHFPDAHATVSAFRRLIEEKVQDILKSSRPDVWKPKDVKATKAEAGGLWVGAGGPMLLEALNGKELVIDVGIKWNAALLKGETAALAAFYSAAIVLGRRVEWNDNDNVRLVRQGNQDWFVVALRKPNPDVVEAFSLAVDAAATAVASAIQKFKTAAPPSAPA
jgi:hypothetical protein